VTIEDMKIEGKGGSLKNETVLGNSRTSVWGREGVVLYMKENESN